MSRWWRDGGIFGWINGWLSKVAKEGWMGYNWPCLLSLAFHTDHVCCNWHSILTISVVTDILGTEKALEQAKKGALYRCNSRPNPSHCCCVAAMRCTLNEPSMILISTTLIILMISWSPPIIISLIHIALSFIIANNNHLTYSLSSSSLPPSSLSTSSSASSPSSSPTYRQIVSAATNEGGYLGTEEVERHHPQVMRFMLCFSCLLAIMRLLFWHRILEFMIPCEFLGKVIGNVRVVEEVIVVVVVVVFDWNVYNTINDMIW